MGGFATSRRLYRSPAGVFCPASEVTSSDPPRRSTPVPGVLTGERRHGRLLPQQLWEQQLPGPWLLEHHGQRPLAAGLHAGRHHPHDRVRQRASHRSGVCPPLAALHLQLLPGVPLPLRPDGGAGGHAAGHAQRAVWLVGAVARLLPRLAVLRRHVLQRLHPQPVHHQPGPLPLHHLAAALQAEDDPPEGPAPSGGRLGPGGAGLLPAHRDEVAQPGPLEWNRSRRRRQHQLLPRVLLPAVALQRPLLSVPPAGHAALCPGGVRPNLLPALQRHLLHLLPHPASSSAPSQEGGGAQPPAAPACLHWGTVPAALAGARRGPRSAGRRRLQPSGAAHVTKHAGEGKNSFKVRF